MRHLKSALLTVLPLLLLAACTDPEKQVREFVDSHVQKIKPIEKERNLADWNAAITGSSEDYNKAAAARLKYKEVYANPVDFTFLKGVREQREVKDSILARQVDVLYFTYLRNQIQPELLKQITDLEAKVEQDFSTFRGQIQGKPVSGNEILDILKKQPDSRKRKEAWEASKQVGPVVAQTLLRLVRLRNQAAHQLGYDNFHTFSLTAYEQDVTEVDRIFNELNELTNEPFAKVKAFVDRVLSKKNKIPPNAMMPWHYEDAFFQEAPNVYPVDYDGFYTKTDVKDLAARFYESMGLPVEQILQNSDLYDRPGKNPHAFSTDIDREGDVRILCNLRNNEQWMGTLLHELGHAVYNRYTYPQIPYLLRTEAHAFTTEGVAIFFEDFATNAHWMQSALGLTDDQTRKINDASSGYRRLKQLIFARWALVMYEFEKSLYANPDQDLGSTWWQLVKKYQLVSKPEGRSQPDWAAKIHTALYPCYYHNYLLGHLFASQLRHYMRESVLTDRTSKRTDLWGKKEAGDYLRKNVFEAADLYHWNNMIRRATGEPLTAKYFVGEYVP